MVEHSIGPRKYDKIKKRLVDTSRYRRFEQPRRKFYASMRQAEDFLSLRDSTANMKYEDVRRRFQDTDSGDRHRSGARKIHFSSSREDTVFSISNGNGHSAVAEEDLSNGEDVTYLETNREDQTDGKEVTTSKKRKFSAQLIRGAFRRRKITLPKWQRKLGIENVSYIENEQNLQVTIRKAKDINLPTDPNLNIIHESDINTNDEASTSDHLRSRSTYRSNMVDSSTQTCATSTLCCSCVQTSVEDIYLRSIGVETDYNSIELELNFDADDKTQENSSPKQRHKIFANDIYEVDEEDGIVLHKNSRAEYLV